ncbi:MAG: deoxyguanosinetriphosphate triphosphohydrolase [Gammaproteobacteria bacterium]
MTATYAAHPAHSRGRQYTEKPSRFRTEFQRDRDRIIHSTAFRRLEYKTQVFVNHEGDLYRTRLTHSLEVAQVGRAVARALHLNEDLTEAICLAHDLGHTPFGHAGQHALNDCMRDYGGFEHNLQSLRVVDTLEEKYPEFSGLNLTYESREGILKHCALRHAKQLGDIGQRFVDGTQPGLEAQLANLADEIAYNNHDVDDGLRSGLITVGSLCEIDLFGRHHRAARAAHPAASDRVIVYETIRRMIGDQVHDLIAHSASLLAEHAPADIDAVRAAPNRLISMSEPMHTAHRELKRYLMANLYRHPKVKRMSDTADRTLRGLFDAYMEDPSRMATARIDDRDRLSLAREIADYIAGMTDRFAFREYDRWCGS